MAIQKLQALTAHLTETNQFADEQFDSWMEGGNLEMASKDLGDGLLICRQKYFAVFSIEKFSGKADELFVHVITWLIDNDPDREEEKLEDPSIDIDILESGEADVTIAINFVENIEIAEDVNGPITFDGKTWSITKVLDSVVEKIGVGHDAALDTDLVYDVNG